MKKNSLRKRDFGKRSLKKKVFSKIVPSQRDKKGTCKSLCSTRKKSLFIETKKVPFQRDKNRDFDHFSAFPNFDPFALSEKGQIFAQNANFGDFGPIWGASPFLGGICPKLGHFGQLWTILGILVTFPACRPHFADLGRVGSKGDGPVCRKLVGNGQKVQNSGKFGQKSRNLVVFGRFWSILVDFGRFWPKSGQPRERQRSRLSPAPDFCKIGQPADPRRIAKVVTFVSFGTFAGLSHLLKNGPTSGNWSKFCQNHGLLAFSSNFYEIA